MSWPFAGDRRSEIDSRFAFVGFVERLGMRMRGLIRRCGFHLHVPAKINEVKKRVLVLKLGFPG